MPKGKSFTSDHPIIRSEIEDWVDQTAMKIDMEKALKGDDDYLDLELSKNAGNVLPCMTMTWFAAHFILNVRWPTILKSIPIVLFADDKKSFLLSVMYKIKGIEMLKDTDNIYRLAKAARFVEINTSIQLSRYNSGHLIN